ncbi:alpha-amylase, partial [bacterium]|nr:alpha-amylase [bacterium]
GEAIQRIAPPANILQLHVNTASAEGTLEGLTRIYTEIAGKLERGDALSAAEKHYIGYDAVQLMPIHPTVEFEGGPHFWHLQDEDATNDIITVSLMCPDMTNWGYDILLCAMNAVNPTALGSKRPDELIDFIAALHNFPGQPIKVILDVVYGHIDNQALPLLNQRFFAGANMYGQNVNFRDPVVRALLLEMQRATMTLA